MRIKRPARGDRRLRRRKYELTHAVVLVLLVTSLSMCIVVGELCMSHYMAYRRLLRTLDDYQNSPGVGATRVQIASVNNTLICIIAASRGNVSYVHTVIRALRDHISVPGVLVDLDDHYAEVQLPNGFVRLVPSDRTKENCDPYEGDIGRPNCVARQQTRDVAVGLRRCTEMAGQHTWVLMLEDDMLPCPDAMRLISSYLSRLDPGMIKTVKFAKFARAVAFPPGNALFYAQDALANILRMPSDLMIDGDWMSATTIVHEGGSLFSHIGAISTNPYRNDISYKEKWKDLRGESCGDLL